MKNVSVEYFVELISQLAQEAVSEHVVWEWLDVAARKVEEDYRQVESLCSQTGYDQVAGSEIEMGMEALAVYRESLDLVAEYLDFGDMTLLEEAAGLAVEVHEKFRGAQAENDRFQQESEIVIYC